jgi:hypothetical protein
MDLKYDNAINENRLLEILNKCASYPEFASKSLSEGSIKHLIVEQLDQGDVKTVSRYLDMAENKMQEVEKYLADIGLDISGDLETFTTAMKKALEQARSELAAAEFDRGWVGNFLGSKITLPSMTVAASYILGKATDFSKGFIDAIEKIVKYFKPILEKTEDKNQSIYNAVANAGLPIKKIESGLRSQLEKSFGAGFLKRAAKFIGGIVGGAPWIGAGKSVIKKFDKLALDPKVTTQSIMDKLFDIKVEDFLKISPPAKVEEMPQLDDTVEDAKEVGEKLPIPEKTKKSDDKIKIDREALGGIAKALGEKPGDPQQRAVGAQLNKILKKKVFVENKNSKSDLARWQILAGIKK